MENTNIIKQAKSDIFKELYSIINFYIKKGASPQALKKYYKSSKKLDDLLDDIKNKSSHLVKDDEYKNLVREILNDMLDDFIAKDKDEEYKNKSKLKHIKEYNSFNENILMDIATWVIGGFLYYGFIKSLFAGRIRENNAIASILDELKTIPNIPIIEYNDRYAMRVQIHGNYYDMRIIKKDKHLFIFSTKLPNDIEVQLTDEEYDEFKNLIKKT